MSAHHPTRRYIKLRNSRQLYQSQDGYFLCVKFRIATISSVTVSITMNSSYVLIIITSSERYSDRVRACPPAPLVNILYDERLLLYTLFKIEYFYHTIYTLSCQIFFLWYSNLSGFCVYLVCKNCFA